MESEKESIVAVVLAMTEAFNKGDIESLMACYEPTATVVFEPGKAFVNGPELREHFVQAFELKPDFRYQGHEVFIAGDTALHMGSWTMTGVAADGSPISDKGLAAQVLRRGADDRWLLVIDDPHGLQLLAS